jgi:tRNA threonylcarbamoyladenosine biosynthesis protein TsaE
MKTRLQPTEQTRFGRTQVHITHANLRKSQLQSPNAQISGELLIIQTVQTFHPYIVEMRWPDESATADFAQTLAAQKDCAQAHIQLQGPLGAGKTSWVRHLLRALGVTGRIKSPTYAVVEPYTTASDSPAWHFDFYRFTDPREWEDAGFRDIFAGPGLKVCEWPQQAQGVLPLADLVIDIEPQTDDSRQVKVQVQTPLGQSLMTGVA